AIKRSEEPGAQESVRGAIARGGFIQGEPIRREKLVKGPNAGFLSALLPAGSRAVAINIDASGGSSAGGFILPNDRVDVVRTSTAADGMESETILTNMRVLAIGQNIEEKNGERVVAGSNATLEADPVQAETLILAQRTGQISLVLRSMMDASGRPKADVAAPPDADRGSVTVIRYGVSGAGKR
ncbi:MAG: cpaB, partial [Hyphomicrobiales bacterium]|nr:cpaB [Hyphomicrobiales bacterium]